MNILIFGASGKTGHQLVSQALEKGHRVTAFVRTPSKLKLSHGQLKIIQGDIIHFASVAEAVKGQHAVLSALGATSPFKFDQVVVDGIDHIVKSMEQADVDRFIYMSFVGVRESRHAAGFVIKYIAPRLLSSEIAGHEAKENRIRQSRLLWTIVRPATLTNGKLTAQYRSGEDISSGGLTATVSRADVADFMLQQLNENTFVRKEPRIMY